MCTYIHTYVYLAYVHHVYIRIHKWDTYCAYCRLFSSTSLSNVLVYTRTYVYCVITVLIMSITSGSTVQTVTMYTLQLYSALYQVSICACTVHLVCTYVCSSPTY